MPASPTPKPLAAIGAAAHELKLPTVRADAARLAGIAVGERQTHLGYARRDPVRRDRRPNRPSRTRRIAEAKFPRIKRLADFNPDAVPGIAATLATLAAGMWIDAGQPEVLLGDSGTGKTHLLIGLGLAAILTVVIAALHRARANRLISSSSLRCRQIRGRVRR